MARIKKNFNPVDLQDTLIQMYNDTLAANVRRAGTKAQYTKKELETLRSTVQLCGRIWRSNIACQHEEVDTVIAENATIVKHSCELCGRDRFTYQKTTEPEPEGIPITSCDECRHRRIEDNFCEVWGTEIDIDGFCYKGEAVEEETVDFEDGELDFIEDEDAEEDAVYTTEIVEGLDEL